MTRCIMVLALVVWSQTVRAGDRMCRLTDWVELANQLAKERAPELADDSADLLELYRLVELEGANPQDHPRLVDLYRRLAASN